MQEWFQSLPEIVQAFGCTLMFLASMFTLVWTCYCFHKTSNDYSAKWYHNLTCIITILAFITGMFYLGIHSDNKAASNLPSK